MHMRARRVGSDLGPGSGPALKILTNRVRVQKILDTTAFNAHPNEDIHR